MQSPQVQSAVHRAEHLLGATFAAEVRGHAERHEKMLQRLRAASLASDVAGVKNSQRLILCSYSSKITCLVRSVEKDDNPTADWMRATAAALDPWKDCGEPIHTWAQPKSSGEGWRPVCSFGRRRTALQTLVADILVAKFGIDPFNYLAKGRGADAASDQIVSLIEAGNHFFVVADIKDFYRSVQQNKVESVTGLPKGVVTNSVLIPPSAQLTVNYLPTCLSLDVFDGAVRSGLIQGSRTSPIVASRLLGLALGQIASADRIVAYGDDTAIAASSKLEADALLKALIGTLESHPAGPFRLKRREVMNARDALDFLKYRHRVDRFTGEVKRRPSPRCYSKYERRVRLTYLTNKPIKALRIIARYRYRWMRAFPRWRWNILSKLLLWQTTVQAMDGK